MLRLYDGNNVSQSDLYKCAKKEFGEIIADFCYNIASIEDFYEFREACAALGKQLVDKPNGTEYYPSAQREEYSKVLNVILLMRYPFLAGLSAYNRFDLKSLDNYKNEDGRSRFEFTELESVLNGWNMRFGLEMCEDIRNILLSCSNPFAAMKGYLVEQVKEKYGTLRWYDNVPVEVSEAMHDMNGLYESLSSRTCDICGSWTDVRIDNGGWIGVSCLRCRRVNEEKTFQNYDRDKYQEKLSSVVSKYGYDKSYVGWEIKDAILNKWVVAKTGSVDTIADNAIVHVYSKNGDEEYNSFDRLRSKYPSLHVIRLVEECDDCIRKNEELTDEIMDKKIEDAIVIEKERMDKYSIKI